MAVEFYMWSPNRFVEISSPHFVISPRAKIKVSEDSDSSMKRIFEDKLAKAPAQSNLEPLPEVILVILKKDNEFDEESKIMMENGREFEEDLHDAKIQSILMVIGMDALRKLEVYFSRDGT